MTTGPRTRRAARAATLLVTGLVLGATSTVSPRAPTVLDAATSCGPAGRISLQEPQSGCGADPTWTVSGGPAVGLPEWAEEFEAGGPAAEVRWILAGPVTLPGTEPPLTVRRRCLVGPEASGVREVTCEGEVPEAACGGSLSPVPTAPGAGP